MSFVRRSSCRFGLVLIFASTIIDVAAAQPSGSRALVGEWIGAWRSTTGSTGFLSITVDAVDGDQVRGSLFMAVTAPDTQGYYNRSVAFRGFLDGAMLRITVLPALSFELAVSGGAMRGTVQGQQTFGTVVLEWKR